MAAKSGKPTPRIKCPDCGNSYDQGAPHKKFCPAKTCTRCGTTVDEVLELDADDQRLCDDCIFDTDTDPGLDEEEDEDEDED